MKKLWKKGFLLTLVLALAFGVCGCGKEAEQEELTEPATETVAPSASPEPTAEGTKSSIECYQTALTRLLEEHVGPDGYVWYDKELTSQDISENEFAVADVDLDGELELIVRWTTTIVAGYRTMVYGYDEERGDLVEKFWGTESCRFYDNGAAQVDSSHNQGRGGRFWPYDVYVRDQGTGEYRHVAGVDAWDFELCPSPAYPKEVDTEGAGFVYYIADAERNGRDTAVSRSDYLAWYEEMFGGAEEITVNYQPLTRENIEKVCARTAYERFLAGDSEGKAAVDEDFCYDIYDSRLADMEQFTIRGLFQRLNEAEGAGNLTYAMMETLGGREMLVLYYMPTAAMGRNLYLVFGVFDGQVRLTYATSFGYRGYTELCQGLVFSGGGSSGAGDHPHWDGYIDEAGHYQALYQNGEVLSGWWVLDYARIHDENLYDQSCELCLLEMDGTRYYELGQWFEDNGPVDPALLAQIREHLDGEGMTETDSVGDLIADAYVARGFPAKPEPYDGSWLPLELNR